MKDTVEIEVWNSAESLMADVPSKTDIDILFLDIELPKLNGVDVGKYIRKVCANEGMHIIYISSKTSYAMELFKIHPYDFLLKPIDGKVICETIENLLMLCGKDKRFFTYYYCRHSNRVLLGNILYLKSDRKHIKLVMTYTTHEYVGKLKDELTKLPSNFVMVGQSYIINLNHVHECFLDHIEMDNGDVIKISRDYRNSFSIKLIEHNKSGGFNNEPG
ncbi:MAG: LytR/AlgR family response regulator transcription factor [Lachnospira sp.]